MKKSVIITAGGIGQRMDSDIPKQFHLLQGRPIIFHSIEKFTNLFSEIEVIVVLPSTHFDMWATLCDKHHFKIEVKLVEGGVERFYSVQNGLKYANGELIAIHDAVRPLVSSQVIEDCFSMAEVAATAIPVVQLKNSIRKITFDESEAVNRINYRLVQTPQVFKANIIKLAYEQAFVNQFTDEATVVEAAGHDVTLVEGNEENIKITTSLDLKIAEVFLT